MSTFAILKPDLVSCPPLFCSVLQKILQSNLRIQRVARLQIQTHQAVKLYREHEGRFYYNRLLRMICSGPAILMELKAKEPEGNPIAEWRKMIGPSKFLRGFGSEEVDRQTFRWQYALSDVRNSAHGADSNESANRELAIFDEVLKDAEMEQLQEWSQLKMPEND